MPTLKTIDLTCPNCHHEFGSSTIDGVPARGRMATDFHVNAPGVQPLAFGVHLCAKCGFSGPAEWFETGVPVSYEVGRNVWNELTPRVGQNMAPSEKYEFAAKVAAWDGAPARTVADLWLRAAWCCVDEGDVEAERFHRRHAAWQFEEALDGYDGVDRDNRAVVTYLVGELWRRIGDAARARLWFDRVADEVTDPAQQEWVLRASRQQRDDPREWFT